MSESDSKGIGTAWTKETWDIMEHMTRRRFVELATIATSGLALSGLAG